MIFKYGYYLEAGNMVADIYKSIQQKYALSLQKLCKETGVRQLSEIEFSTLINFNREMYSSLKSAVFAAKDYLLDTGKAAYFDDLPEFIR